LQVIDQALKKRVDSSGRLTEAEFLGRLVALVNSRDERVAARVLPVALEYTFRRAPLIVDVAMPVPPPIPPESMVTLSGAVATKRRLIIKSVIGASFHVKPFPVAT
jgi:hypothetical protein